jgi:ABC-type Mn2+/Zn2+ transport system permease subunit
LSVEVLDAMLEPVRSEVGRRALVEVLLLGSFCGALGFWVLSERLAYGAESLAHGLLPGLVLAALAGVPLPLGAALGALGAALLIGAAARDERVGADTGTAVAVTGLVGLGALLAFAPDSPQRLEELLFGDLLGVSDADLLAAAALAVLGAMALAALHRPLSAVAFDPASAASAGLAPGRVRLCLLMLLAAALAVAVQGLGSLLVLAVLVGPALAVEGHVGSPAASMAAGGAVAAAAGLAGIYASFHLEVAAGAAVALALCLAAGLGTALRRLRRQLGPVRAARAGAR